MKKILMQVRNEIQYRKEQISCTTCANGKFGLYTLPIRISVLLKTTNWKKISPLNHTRTRTWTRTRIQIPNPE